jgi:thiamine-monophosphate kinase
VSSEFEFIDLLRRLPLANGARGLLDDAATLTTGGETLVLTSDTLVEAVHYRADDSPETIGWKLAAVNLSDLAAKGARPVGCLMNYALSGDPAWDSAFLSGLRAALDQYGMPLLGGDTVRMPDGASRSYTLTAIGAVMAGGRVPDRAGAQPGDILWLGGPVGDAGAGLALLNRGEQHPEALISTYLTPQPQLALGQVLAPIAHAMMDVSDGLLIDARRMARASDVALVIEQVPLSMALAAHAGRNIEARLAAATAGDDYVLLAALAPEAVPPLGCIAIGYVEDGEGVRLRLDGEDVSLPPRLGWEHGSGRSGG